MISTTKPNSEVISPLLANIYLNNLDTIWEDKFTELGTLVRYEDDLVILCKTQEQALKSIDVLKAAFGKLELQMNTSTSKLINLLDDKAGFDFLACITGKSKAGQGGRSLYPPKLPLEESHEEDEREGKRSH